MVRILIRHFREIIVCTFVKDASGENVHMMCYSAYLLPIFLLQSM